MGSSISGNEVGRTEVGTPREASSDGCARCGYDLRGVADDAPCPECGLLAERSRRRDGHLSDATPGWLRGIAVGVTLVLLAHVIAPVWLVLIIVAAESRGIGRAFVGTPMNPADLSILGFDLAALVLLVGVWLLTRPQHPAARDGLLRWSLRAASLGPAVAVASLHVAFHVAGFGVVTPRVAIAVALLLTVGLAPIPAMGFALLRRLAKRLLDPSLAEHAAIVGVGLSLVLVAILPFLWAMHPLDGRPSPLGLRGAMQLLVPTFAMALFLLFAGWSAWNCVRFALAFRKAYRGARHKWRLADRAV